MCLLSSQNVSEFSAPLGPYGNQHRTMSLRNFPKESRLNGASDTETGSGTGFFSTQHLGGTRHHVVADAKKISLSNGRVTVQAELLLKDSQNDLALLRINAANPSTAVTAVKSVKCLVMGNSDEA